MKLLIATANAHKVEEISHLLGNEYELVSLREFPAIEMPEETGETMAQNARIKAVACARASGLPALADDSGIEVDALGGAPGVYSARWVEGSDAGRNQALLDKLRDVEEAARTARYRCAICVAWPDGVVLETEGTCEGAIAFEPRGGNGFGYDPIFKITEGTGAPFAYRGRAMAQVPAEIKARVSHRAHALARLKTLLNPKIQEQKTNNQIMSEQLNHLLENNKRWVEGITERDDQFFHRLAAQQTPKYLWIGCSDSRVPANEIIGLLPGEVFVHRNVANVVVHSDLNCLSVIQYAVEVLKVEHILVVGHYGCGGVRAALGDSEFGLIDNWLRHIKDVREKYQAYLEEVTDQREKEDKMCELNVIEQVFNVCHTTIVQNAWKNGQKLTVRGWVYSLEDGLIRDLKVAVSSRDGISSVYRTAG